MQVATSACFVTRYLLLVLSFMLCCGVNANANSVQPQSSDFRLGVTESSMLGTNGNNIGLKTGARVDNFRLQNHRGEWVEFFDVLNQGAALVIFYRGGWSPYCNVQIREYADFWLEFEKRGIKPVFISADRFQMGAKLQSRYQAPFTIFADPDLVAHQLFDVTLDLDEKTVAGIRENGINIEQWSGRKHHKLAAPSVFIINKNAEVIWVHTSVDYTVRPSVKQVLGVIDNLRHF